MSKYFLFLIMNLKLISSYISFFDVRGVPLFPDFITFFGEFVDMNFIFNETIVCGYYMDMFTLEYTPVLLFYDLLMNFKSLTYYNKIQLYE
jgi:hypothetical protein